MKSKILFFLFCSVLNLALWAQDELLILEQSKSGNENLKQIELLDKNTAIILRRSNKGMKLVNTLELIRNNKTIDTYQNKTSLDHIYLINSNEFIVFESGMAQSHFKIKNDSIHRVDRKSSIPFPRIIWTTNFREGLLLFYRNQTFFYSQGINEPTLNRFEKTSTPLLHIWKNGDSTSVNTKNLNSTYEHWPEYTEGIIPPHNYLKIKDNLVYFPISNTGELFIYDTATENIYNHPFQSEKKVKSWTVEVDVHTKNTYVVTLINKSLFEIYPFNKTMDHPTKSVSFEYYAGSIADNFVLVKYFKGNLVIFKSISLNL